MEAKTLEEQSAANVKQALEGKVIELPQELPPRKVKAHIEITLFEDGDISINGPMEDRLLWKGVLGVADDLAKQYWQNTLREAAERARLAAKPIKKFSKEWWAQQFAARAAAKKASAAAIPGACADCKDSAHCFAVKRCAFSEQRGGMPSDSKQT